MSKLVYAAVNYLLQKSDVTSLLGSDDLGPWLFANQPEATIENTGDVMVVITSTNGWGANDHNTARFPVLTIDIWADPTRNPDRSVKRKDADLKIEAVFLAIDKYLHLTNKSVPGGASVMWGTATEIANRTGQRIIESSRQNEPELSPAFDDEGALMGRFSYNAQI